MEIESAIKKNLWIFFQKYGFIRKIEPFHLKMKHNIIQMTATAGTTDAPTTSDCLVRILVRWYHWAIFITDLYNTLDAQSMQSRVLHGRLSRHLYLSWFHNSVWRQYTRSKQHSQQDRVIQHFLKQRGMELFFSF